jgi:hypothetical protein
MRRTRKLCKAQQISITTSRTPSFHNRIRSLTMRQRLTLLLTCSIRSRRSFRVKAPVTRRPPHRSGREGFPHPVPRSPAACVTGEPHRRHPVWRLPVLSLARLESVVPVAPCSGVAWIRFVSPASLPEVPPDVVMPGGACPPVGPLGRRVPTCIGPRCPFHKFIA